MYKNSEGCPDPTAGAAYEYTRGYRRFMERHDAEKKNDKNQIGMF